jgi:signal peptidase II
MQRNDADRSRTPHRLEIRGTLGDAGRLARAGMVWIARAITGPMPEAEPNRERRQPMILERGLALAAVVALLDQLSKAAVLRFFGETGCAIHHLPVARFFDLVLTCNTGISFGMFNRSGVGSLVFAVAGAAIIVVLLFWLSRVRSKLMAVALGLVIGGAIGNVIDRLRFDGVIDFLYFHIGSWGWPAFNLADSAICLGVAAILLDGMLSRREGPHAIQSKQAIQGEDVSQ